MAQLKRWYGQGVPAGPLTTSSAGSGDTAPSAIVGMAAPQVTAAGEIAFAHTSSAADWIWPSTPIVGLRVGLWFGALPSNDFQLAYLGATTAFELKLQVSKLGTLVAYNASWQGLGSIAGAVVPNEQRYLHVLATPTSVLVQVTRADGSLVGRIATTTNVLAAGITRARIAVSSSGAAQSWTASKLLIDNAAMPLDDAGTQWMRPVSATIAASSVVSARVTARRQVAATVAASSATTAQATARRRVSATVGGTSDVSASATARRQVSALIAGTSGTQVQATARRRVSATIAASSSVTATATARRAVSAAIAGASSTTGKVTARRAVGATIEAASMTTAAVTARRAVSARIDAVSDTTAVVTARRAVSALVEAVSAVYASVTTQHHQSARNVIVHSITPVPQRRVTVTPAPQRAISIREVTS